MFTSICLRQKTYFTPKSFFYAKKPISEQKAFLSQYFYTKKPISRQKKIFYAKKPISDEKAFLRQQTFYAIFQEKIAFWNSA